ncbi:cation:proton antiporter domain-containing protein [Thermomonospora amylolytica]|uniref:cation:proton antiporter domain-containing protein n=1 Tax=Thermomonospora amylolytica TaxID=1411117 RepID=UPI000E6CD21E|nr:cation:proton antiporter [Thermomonospora amylolytica]
MDAADVAVVAAAIFLWGAFSGRLQRLDVTAAIAFVALGVLVAVVPGALEGAGPEHEPVRLLAEATLVLVLFADAARIDPRDVRADLGLDARLLVVGLPMTVAAGTVLAYLLFPDGGLWLALLVGAALAPTDAALGSSMMNDPAVPARVRRLINVESGLNDGIVTPVVVLAIAGAAGHFQSGSALGELALGGLVGAVVGAAGGALLRGARERGWTCDGFAGPAVLGLAGCAYATAVATGGNGFIAAFVGGAAFGAAAGDASERLVPFVEEAGGLACLLVWFLFGAVAVVPAVEGLTWQAVLYAVLSLTVLRMVPVALALVGSGLLRTTVAFVGWFGPRGLPSVIFALLALEGLGEGRAGQAVTVIAVTVLLSVLAHGVTSVPLARRYGARVPGTALEQAASSQPPPRSLVRRAAGRVRVPHRPDGRP